MANITMWMVRAGQGGSRFDDFKINSIVSIGWANLGDMSAFISREDFQKAVAVNNPNHRPGQIIASASQAFRFVKEIEIGDGIITYDPSERIYLIGKVTDKYKYLGDHTGQPNCRAVNWQGTVLRDSLSVSARNSLGSIATLFKVPTEVTMEIELFLQKASSLSVPQSQPLIIDQTIDVDQVDDLYKDIQAKGFEFIKDKVNELNWEDMQELVAGLLRAMGYKTRVSPSGSDRGKDIVASPDGLGFEDPRIVVEVKHRTASMGSQDIRSFLGGRHENDKGLYVSTGGFTREARYEAERGRIPLTLMDLDDLVKSLLEHYERMDLDMQRLIPLRKLYWPS